MLDAPEEELLDAPEQLLDAAEPEELLEAPEEVLDDREEELLGASDQLNALLRAGSVGEVVAAACRCRSLPVDCCIFT